MPLNSITHFGFFPGLVFFLVRVLRRRKCCIFTCRGWQDRYRYTASDQPAVLCLYDANWPWQSFLLWLAPSHPVAIFDFLDVSYQFLQHASRLAICQTFLTLSVRYLRDIHASTNTLHRSRGPQSAYKQLVGKKAAGMLLTTTLKVLYNLTCWSVC